MLYNHVCSPNYATNAAQGLHAIYRRPMLEIMRLLTVQDNA